MSAVIEYPELSQEDCIFLSDTLCQSESLLRDIIASELRRYQYGNKDVEDILDKVYDTAYRRIANLRSSPNPTGWLVNTAKNKLKTYFRDNNRTQLFEDGRTISDFRTEIDLGLEEIFTDKIKEPERDLLKRRFVNGDRVKEIAHDLQTKESTIKKRLRKVKDKVRNILKIK